MDEWEIKNLVKVWYDKAMIERDIFSKFVFLWICFNAWLAYRTGKVTDKEMIDHLKLKGPLVLDIVSAYDRASESNWFKDKIQDLKNLSPINDAMGRRASVSIQAISNFEEICAAIYRIRCNLFHGGKSSNGNRDRKLVKVAGDILGKWIGNLVNSWKSSQQAAPPDRR